MKAILTTVLPATDFKPTHIRANEPDGKSVTVSWDYGDSDYDQHHAAACKLRDKLGWEGKLIGGDLKFGMCFVFERKQA